MKIRSRRLQPGNEQSPPTSFGLPAAYVVLALFAFVIPFPVLAQSNFSVPADSWTYGAIQELQTRGFLLDLSPGFKPYTRGEIAHALEALKKKDTVAKLSRADKWLLEKLEKEFSGDMVKLRLEASAPDTSFTGARISEEDFVNLAKGDYAAFKRADKLEFRPTLRTGFGVNFGNHLSLYADATIDQTLKDDTLYSGSTKFGLDALHQQAYVRYSAKYFDFTFGRDYLSWGYGDNGKVMVSTTPGALDMASLFVRTKVLKFNWFVAQLNPMPEFIPDTNNYSPYGPTPTYGQPDPLANRYLTGSRIEFNIGNKLFIGAYQAALFGGPYASINFENVNPVRLNYETSANEHPSLANNFLGLDASLFWPADVNIYGNLMIDDWQVDRQTIGDLKPDLYSVQTGVRLADVFQTLGLVGTDVSFEYAMAGNRVYNEYNWWAFQKLLLRNYPIASPFGDDFWDIDLRLSQWLSSEWKLSLDAMHLEHGSSNIYSFYSMPWLTDPSITVQTGYHEPFPFGVIQETNLLRLDALYQPAVNFYGSLSLMYTHDRNADYLSGITRDQFSFLLTFYYDFSRSLLFN